MLAANKSRREDAPAADQRPTKTTKPEEPSEDMHTGFCHRCNTTHDWRTQEYMECIPPPSVLLFGPYRIDPAYRLALNGVCDAFTTEEVVGSFLGHNPYFPSQEAWLAEQHAHSSDEDHASWQCDDPSEADDDSSDSDDDSSEEDDISMWQDDDSMV